MHGILLNFLFIKKILKKSIILMAAENLAFPAINYILKYIKINKIAPLVSINNFF